jgi:hypothetical protein
MFLVLLFAVVGARRSGNGRLPVGWAVACGVALGLALSSKHTAILSLAALLGWGLLVATWDASRAGSTSFRMRLISGWRAARGWVLAAVVGFGVFVLANPHFYPNPPLHLWHIVEARRQVIREHQQNQSRQAIYSRLERARLVFGRALNDDTASGSRGLPLEAALVPLGAAVLLLTTVRGARRTGHLPVEGLVLLTVAVYFVGISAGLYVDWERYFLPSLLVGLILSGVGTSAVLGQLASVWSDRRAHRGGQRRGEAIRSVGSFGGT